MGINKLLFIITSFFCILNFQNTVKIFFAHAKNVTYPGIGTFTDRDFYDPIRRPIVVLPRSPEEIDPKFMLYTRKNQYNPDMLIYNSLTNYTSSNFNPKLETHIIVHGFLDNVDLVTWMEKMKNYFLAYKESNIIIVDWKKGNFFPYSQATANSRVVGPMIAILIKNLCKAFNITEDSFHIIGHSLGAHLAGYAGKFLQGKLGHITGLDPAGPYFEGLNQTAARLWHTDAKFVESIHTDGRLIPYLGFGMYETCSHIDIYPNGGRGQPGCDKDRSVIPILLDGLYEKVRFLIGCNHIRAIDFYMELILGVQTVPTAYACNDYKSFQEGKCIDCGPDSSNCIDLGLQMNKNYKNFSSLQERFFMSTALHKKFFSMDL